MSKKNSIIIEFDCESLCEYNYRKAKFLNDASVFSSSESRVLFAFGAGADHFARAEYESGCSRRAYSHDYGCETFRVVLGVASIQCDLFQVQCTA